MTNVVKIIEVDEFGRPQKCICPECGQKVEIIESAISTGSSLKRINRALASGGNPNYGISKSGLLSCGHILGHTYNIHDGEIKNGFNIICRVLELANDINDAPTGVSALESFADKIFELYPGGKRSGNFKIEEYESFLKEFPGIEKFLSKDYKAWKLHKDLFSKEINPKNIILKYSQRTIFDSELSYSLEEYDNLSEEDKQDKRYENYLFNLLKEVFPVYLEDYPGMKMCPIDQWDIPEEKRIQVAEFTIQLYRQRG